MAYLAFAAVVAAFLTYHELKDRRHARQVADLCQRIQAPELAIHEHQAVSEPERLHVRFDDDQDFIDASRELAA